MTDRQPLATAAPVDVGRRHVLLGAGALGVASVLAACGGDSETGGPAEATAEPPAGTSAAPTGDGAAGELVAVTDVPVGGGVIVAAEKVVVTQPSAGEFRGFSSTCTHQACQVTSVMDGQIRCECHGSRYSIEDGSVAGGPAPEPLPEVPVSVRGDQVVKA
ncbi:MAG: Rieske 2Fe-2S domain-containing protein [Jiangellaceae bacterium]|nr:Rieske 2Fe-2S domain-containing protein [Jiangellaceae bacterium]